MAQFKKLSDVELVEEMPEGATQLIVDNDEIKQVPASTGGGGAGEGTGGITLALVEYMEEQDTDKDRQTAGAARLMDKDGKFYTGPEIAALIKGGYAIDLMVFDMENYPNLDDGIYFYEEWMEDPFNCSTIKVLKMEKCTLNILEEEEPIPEMLMMTANDIDIGDLEDKDISITLDYRLNAALPTFLGSGAMEDSDIDVLIKSYKTDILRIRYKKSSYDIDIFDIESCTDKLEIPYQMMLSDIYIARLVPSLALGRGTEWYDYSLEANSFYFNYNPPYGIASYYKIFLDMEYFYEFLCAEMAMDIDQNLKICIEVLNRGDFLETGGTLSPIHTNLVWGYYSEDIVVVSGQGHSIEPNEEELFVPASYAFSLVIPFDMCVLSEDDDLPSTSEHLFKIGQTYTPIAPPLPPE